MEHFKVAKPAIAWGKKATIQNIKEDNLSKKVDSSMGHLEYEAGVLATTITFINYPYKEGQPTWAKFPLWNLLILQETSFSTIGKVLYMPL